MTSEGSDKFTGGDVPNLDGFVVGGGAEAAGVGGEGDVGDFEGVAGEDVDGGEGGGGVGSGGFVGGGSGEESAVVGEFDGEPLWSVRVSVSLYGGGMFCGEAICKDGDFRVFMGYDQRYK